MADGRYSSFYMSDGALLALDFPDEDDFGIIPPFDDVISVPPELDPPKPDDDDTLPSKAHPSYPYGPPYSQPTRASPFHHPNPSSFSQQPTWGDLALRDLLAHEMGKEVPPGMAGAKRGPQEDRSEDEEGEDGEPAGEGSGSESEDQEEESEQGEGTVAGSASAATEGSRMAEEESEEGSGEVRDLDDEISGSEEPDEGSSIQDDTDS
ncbi:hypothetical protein BDY24DRAFT_395293 [Mrakia frigida]|uniref:uncharacterized protein n=1 Tax=Mrakia frigida TaxID=29902 RepID=UPI003FCC1A46